MQKKKRKTVERKERNVLCAIVFSVHVTCTLSTDGVVALLAAHTAVRSLCVHTLLAGTRVSSLALIHICRQDGQRLDALVCVQCARD